MTISYHSGRETHEGVSLPFILCEDIVPCLSSRCLLLRLGLYVSKTCTNLLDEVFGKGSYAAILNSSGYVYGMTMNLAEYYAKIKRHDDHARENLKQAQSLQQSIDRNFDLFEQMKGE